MSLTLRTGIFERANCMIVALKWVLTIQFVVLAVAANEVCVYLRAGILYSISVVYSSNKIAAWYCSDSKGSGFKFTAGSDSNDKCNQFHTTTDLVYI